MISTSALRAKHLDNQYALQQAIVDALGGDAADPDTAFRVRPRTTDGPNCRN